MRSLAVAVVVVVELTACSHAGPKPPAWPDAPPQLRDHSDRDQAIDQLWVLGPGRQRDLVRADVVAAIARRISDAVEEDKPFVAETLVFQLASLWQADPDQIGRGLATEVPLLHQLRALFAKSGAIEPTLASLVLLAEVEPDSRAAHLAEIDEILTFSDELAATENGPASQRAQPIALIQPTVLALPLRWLVDHYVALLEERQRVIVARIEQQGASIELVRAHHDILSTAHRIANVLARAGRTDEIHRHLATLKGLGADRELAIRAEILADQPTADAYLELARALRSDEHAPDATAALGVGLAGLAKFPRDASLLAAAAGDAAQLGRVAQPIGLYEAALAQGGEVDAALALRLGKLYAERIARLAFSSRPRAATNAWHEVARFVSSRKPAAAIWDQVAAIAETALGRGLVSLGRLAEAEHALVASLGRAPSIDAYETLATIRFKTGQLASASRYATAGLALLGDTTAGDRYRRARLDRLAADVQRTAAKPRDASALYRDALRAWAALGPDKDLSRTIAGERKLELGRDMWFLGDAGQAVDFVLDAVDLDPDSAATVAGAAAFLFEIGRPLDALDAVHRGLSSSGVGELTKVYLCLWALADARHRGAPRDRQAYEYLASRHGDLWYELLAETATGRLDFAALAAAAVTAPRQAQLAFYGAALGLDPAAAAPAAAHALLVKVVDARLVMDAEYDLARQYLIAP